MIQRFPKTEAMIHISTLLLETSLAIDNAIEVFDDAEFNVVKNNVHRLLQLTHLLKLEIQSKESEE